MARQTQLIPVKVDDMIIKAGKVIPLTIKPGNDSTYKIDKVLSINDCITLMDKATGIRYTCRISECEFYLFHNGSQWYIVQ